MLGVLSTALQRLFPNCGRVHPKVMSQCVTRTERIHPGNKPTNPPRGIHSTFQTRGPGKTGQMPWAYQISKLYKVHSLFRNFKFEQAFPVRVRWLPADLKYQKPEQNTKQRYTQVCTNYIHSCFFFSMWKAVEGMPCDGSNSQLPSNSNLGSHLQHRQGSTFFAFCSRVQLQSATFWTV